MTTMHRRRLLSLGMAAAAGAAAVPTVFVRRARAATDAFGSAKHVLVLFARGGLRSHCLFNAVASKQHNPHGTQVGATGTQWPLGAIFGAEEIVTPSGQQIPSFASLSNKTAVLTSVDVAPEVVQPRIGHVGAVEQLGSGSAKRDQGLLSLVVEAHARYANGFGTSNLPPVDIGTSVFGRSAGGPPVLGVPNAHVAVERQPVVRDWSTAVREQRNALYEENTAQTYAERVAHITAAKTDSFAFSELLVDPRLDVLGAPEATFGGMSNAMLLDILGGSSEERGRRDALSVWGPDVALAVRMFGFGAPMALVERNLFDTHAREDETLPELVSDLARQLAGLRFALLQMEHPDGGSYWDHTVVTVVSEFNRNNGGEDGGYNSAQGSDHVLDDAHVVRNQAVPLMGGPIEASGAGGRMITGTDDELRPDGPSVSMRSVYSTLLDLLGAPHEAFWDDAAIAELFV